MTSAATIDDLAELQSRIVLLSYELDALRRNIKKMEDFPAMDAAPADTRGWQGVVYVNGVPYTGLTDTSKPYVKVTLGAGFGGSVTVVETDDDFPDEMPPNEEWYKKSEEKSPPRITRFG